MKTMKYIYRYILILSTLMLAVSCVEKISDADILAGRDRTTIEVSYAMAGTEVKSMTVASSSVKKTLEVTVNNENLKWNLESNRDWCVVVPEEHCGSGTVTLSIAANEDFESREPATLTFVAGDYRGFEITVNQNASAFIIGQPYFVSGIAGGAYTVNVTTPAGTDWDFTAENWMEVTEGTPSSTEDLTTTTLTINALENDGASRYGEILLSAGEETGKINIYQFGTELNYDESGVIVLEGAEGANLTLTAPAYVVNAVQAPKFATAVVTENEDGTSTVSVSFKENLSDCSENRAVELSLQLSNASASVVELPAIIQEYIPANGLVTGKGMMTFAKAVAEGAPTTDWEDNGVVTVKGEIDMSGVEGWTGVGTAESPFKGQFNGGGYEITNLKNTSAGLFAYCEGATIQNVVLGMGCSLYFDKEYTGLGGAFGGIVSVAKETKVTDCQFNGAMDFAGTNDNDEPAYVGGVVGYADENTTVTKSRMGGKIVITSSSTATDSYVGGVVGMSYGTVTNNEMSGEIVAQTGNILTVGGIASAIPAETKVGSNSFMGTLTMASGATSQMIFGGLYGKILADRTFDKASDKSVSLGTININSYTGSATTSLFVGGFVGRAEAGVALSFNGYENQTSFSYDQTANARATLYACFGGILGGCDPGNKVKSVTFENISNQGTFTTEYNSANTVSLYHGFVGGIAGFINGDATFVNCKNQGELGKRLSDSNNKRSNGYNMIFGGVAASIIGGDAKFTKCENVAKITNAFYSNHFIGYSRSQDTTTKIWSDTGWIDNTTKDGNSVTWYSPCTTAGILGAFDYRPTSVSGQLTMTECVNSASIFGLRGNTAGVVGYARNATISSCTNTGDLPSYYNDGKNHDSPNKGGIAARLDNAKVSNCVVKCHIYACVAGSAKYNLAGGVVSLAQGTVDIDGCSYYGEMVILRATEKTPAVGGVLSEVGPDAVVSITNCKLGGSIDGAPVNANNVASLAIALGEATVTGITLWNGTL